MNTIIYMTTGKFIPPTVNMSQSRIYLKSITYNLSMRCVPHDNGFHYLWERKNNNLMQRAHGMYSSELTIANLQPEDSGEYRCIISNATGTITSSYSKLIVRSMYKVLYVKKICACVYSRIKKGMYYNYICCKNYSTYFILITLHTTHYYTKLLYKCY